MKLREVKKLVPGHKAKNDRSWDLKPQAHNFQGQVQNEIVAPVQKLLRISQWRQQNIKASVGLF